MPAERNVGKLPLFPSADTSADWNRVAPAIRNNAFFSACIEEERFLAALQELVSKGLDEGWSVGQFVDEALQMLDEIMMDPDTIQDEITEDNFMRLYDVERLRLIYLTQRELSAGWRNFVKAFDPFFLQMYPAWEFWRQEGAKEENKRKDHVQHEGDIRLKTDVAYWLERNRAEIGGFGNPYGPWGFNSWMTTIDVERDQAEALGLVKPGERLTIPPELVNWNLPQAIRQTGRAGVSDLTPEQQQNVIDHCQEEGINVTQPEENVLEVTPDPDNPDDPLNILDEDVMEEWMRQEEERLRNMSDEDIFNEWPELNNIKY